MRVLKLIIAICILIWSVGYFTFLNSSKNFTIDTSNLSDVVIVFGGKKQRLYTGVQLVKLGYSPYMFVTGDKPLSEYLSFLKAHKISREHFIFDVDFAHQYKDYALEAAIFIRKNQFTSARVVADASQISRAMIEIRSHVAIGTKLIPHPVSFKGGNYTKMFVEYNKFVFVFLANMFGFANNVSLLYT